MRRVALSLLTVDAVQGDEGMHAQHVVGIRTD
jgi:hypothetical protein